MLHHHNHPGQVQTAIQWPTCRVDPAWTPPPTMRNSSYVDPYVNIYIIIIIIIIIIITPLEPFVGPWPLFEFLVPIESVRLLGRGISPS
jgi:hypothetical protein